MTDLKELQLHTLRGDIQTCGMDGMKKEGIRKFLFERYVNGEIPMTEMEFINTLNEQYAKVEEWRKKSKKQTVMTRYEAFVTELETLSVKYGVTIKAIGGVTIWDDGELKDVEYTKDETSGDIYAKKINGK